MSSEQVKALHVPAIEQADKELQMISQDRDLRVQYEMRLKAELDAASWQADWIEAGKKLGLDEGKKLGLDEGKKLGLDEGKKLDLDEGEKKGKTEGQAITIIRLLQRRDIALSEADLARITSCRDEAQFERWTKRLLDAKTAADLFCE